MSAHLASEWEQTNIGSSWEIFSVITNQIELCSWRISSEQNKVEAEERIFAYDNKKASKRTTARDDRVDL